MHAYDRFIEEASHRLGLGHRTRWVVDVIAGWIASHPRGLDGLEQTFEQAGLGVHFRSWRRPGQPPLPVLASDLQRALGDPVMDRLARRSRLSSGAFRVVACDLLPGLIALTSQPIEPAPSEPRQLRNRPQRQRPQMAGTLLTPRVQGMALRSLLWMMAAVVVLGATAWLQLKARTPLWTPQAIVREHDARLFLHQRGAQVSVHGSLPSDALRRRLWSALIAVHGAGHVSGRIEIDPQARSPRWFERLIRTLPCLQGDGLRLEFAGNQLDIDSTALSEERRLAISRQLRQDFPALRMSGLWGPGRAALSRLPADAGAAQRIAALNLTRLEFHPGSSELRGSSSETLQVVAEALRSTAPGTRVEVAAHTDSQGASEANRQLSQQRADVVVTALQAHGVPAPMLVAVGHGEEHPVADNRSEDGRARNQRIVYRLLAAPH